METSLAELRQEIDAIDDRVHDLLMRRGEVQARVGAAKAGDDAAYIRPGREALVLRRLVARHRGSFPKAVLVRIWREIFAAGLSLQGAFSVAVPDGATDGGARTLAADHFGALTPTHSPGGPADVIAAVRDGAAAVGVLPVPGPEDPDPWWRTLARDAAAPAVIARLPFAPAASRAGPAEAFVIGRAPVEDTGHDRSLLVLDADADPFAALHPAGLEGEHLATAPADNGGGRLHLMLCPGVVRHGDARLDALTRQPGVAAAHPLGAYAVPFTADELA